jgi:L-ribulose-5-phosphate 3-epimerase
MAEQFPATPVFKLSRQIGVMQGRLSGPVKGRIQGFPAAEWPGEFPSARALGLSSIEWIFETPVEENPLWTDAGLELIRHAIKTTAVNVNFICADIFMESPWVEMSRATCEQNQAILKRLIDQAARLGCRGIEIPCVDASEIRSSDNEDELLAGLEPCLDHAARNGIEIGLETSLPPERFARLLERCGHPAIRANYDTGNSASLGYNGPEEIQAYGRWINNVHIKDRKHHGSTVPLGTGDADIPAVLSALRRSAYAGGFILQAARQHDEMKTVRGYYEQLDQWLTQTNGESNGSQA